MALDTWTGPVVPCGLLDSAGALIVIQTRVSMAFLDSLTEVALSQTPKSCRMFSIALLKPVPRGYPCLLEEYVPARTREFKSRSIPPFDIRSVANLQGDFSVVMGRLRYGPPLGEVSQLNCAFLRVGLMLTVLLGCSDSGEEFPGIGSNSIVFAQRGTRYDDGSELVRPGQVVDYAEAVPNGRLVLWSPSTKKQCDLTASYSGVDINGIDISFDMTQVVFAMAHAGDRNHQIYVASLECDPTIRQLTLSESSNVKPRWISENGIAFLTNRHYTEMGRRADEYGRGRDVVQLALMTAENGEADLRLCSQSLSHSAEPFLMSDGRIGFSRWEHLGPINDVKLYAMNPDCTQMIALAGHHGKPANSLVQFSEIAHGRYLGIATSLEGTFQAGAIVELDTRSSTSLEVLDEEHVRYQMLTPAVPTGPRSPPTHVGRYAHPISLDDDRLLVSWANGDVNERSERARAAPNFGLYLFDRRTGTRTLLYDDPLYSELMAHPVVDRRGHAVRDAALGRPIDSSEPATLGSVDITVTSLDEVVRGGPLDGMDLSDALAHAQRVRIIEGFSSEVGSMREFGLTTHEGAAIVGEATVYSDGSFLASVPARLPYRLQPIDEYGMSIRSQMLWIQAMPGEERQCGGCHARRTETVHPRKGGSSLARQAGPQDFDLPIAARRELPWNSAIQPIFDANCTNAGCHGSVANVFASRSYQVVVPAADGGSDQVFDIPYLNLSSEPAQAHYRIDVVEYPLSYISLLYPSAMMGEITAVGDVPPIWVVPGSARTSRLIE
ncbi:MAG: hypothetical protein AAF550_11325, partial [Myxococcota bacterium]